MGVNENLPFAAAIPMSQCLGTVVDSVAFSNVLKEQCVSPGWELKSPETGTIPPSLLRLAPLFFLKKNMLFWQIILL